MSRRCLDGLWLASTVAAPGETLQPSGALGGDVDIQWEGLQGIQGEVVVVEDDPTLRELMVEIVQQLNAPCVAFDNADDALIHMLQPGSEFALLIADHGVPGSIQGLELSSMVRSKWRDVGIILTSGYLLEAATLPAGVAYLLKPWAIDDLVMTIARLVQPERVLRKKGG